MERRKETDFLLTGRKKYGMISSVPKSTLD
jgi:hypothetical protein